MSLAPLGHLRWAISAGAIPSTGCGAEPEFTSRDAIGLLNAGAQLANVRITVVYAERRSIGPFRLGIAPRRVRHIRVNDLIFPEAVRLDEPYGLTLESDQPIVVQFTRQDTRARALAGMICTAWSDDREGDTIQPRSGEWRD